MKNTIKYISILGISALFASQAFACEDGCEDHKRKFYVGGDVGISGPLKAKFEDKATKSVFSIKKTAMYTGKLGYRVTPDIAIEFAYDYKPSYRLGVKLAEEFGGDRENTRAKSDAYMLNFIYNTQELAGFQPFIMIGVGLVQVKVKEVAIIASQSHFVDFDKFRSLKHTSNSFSWQVGLGFSKTLIDNFRINIAGKIQIAHDVVVKYRGFDQDSSVANLITTGNAVNMYNTGKIKKTFGLAEASIGFTYDLPF